MPGCKTCRCHTDYKMDITMAMQPIVDLRTRQVYAYEALVRGTQGQSAGQVLAQVTEDSKYYFDQLCRTTAIEMMAGLSDTAKLSINFLPNAIYDPQTCLRKTLEAADKFNLAKERIIFEVSEQEHLTDHEKLIDIANTYNKNGFKVALDDFGAGYAGIEVLHRFQPDIIKLDISLINGIAQDPVKQAVVDGICLMARRLGIDLVVEGVETLTDYRCLCDLGVYLMQGYLFAKPVIATLPNPSFPAQPAEHPE
ncbi:EAL domain-containing protein [Pseudoalteromonas rubra]|uniref:Diguanylate phosphodiesterase n=1 Tax=Pseudoalteromonas rubra TaxID=43658 RepID=A0A0F4QQS1_9GAMM|nr:EAL domain-containing protein [Pseudoalteromonas rubra]KJZ08952.1 diguanylate phosphodiesterase [Pseudoalteromonas rubra]